MRENLKYREFCIEEGLNSFSDEAKLAKKAIMWSDEQTIRKAVNFIRNNLKEYPRADTDRSVMKNLIADLRTAMKE